MGFTWIHLNQVNVGTNVAAGRISYQRWCTLTRVNKWATLNTCTNHKKWCSKGKQGSWCQGQERVDEMAQTRQDSSVTMTQTHASRKYGSSSSATSVSRGGTKQQCRQTNEEQQVLDASSPLTQANSPRIIEAVSPFLSAQPLHPLPQHQRMPAHQTMNLSTTWVRI